MYGICLRYGGNATDAEEILQNGFIRLFTNLGHFRFEGPLEGWARSIFINAAISYNKKFMKLRQEVELAFAGDFYIHPGGCAVRNGRKGNACPHSPVARWLQDDIQFI